MVVFDPSFQGAPPSFKRMMPSLSSSTWLLPTGTGTFSNPSRGTESAGSLVGTVSLHLSVVLGWAEPRGPSGLEGSSVLRAEST